MYEYRIYGLPVAQARHRMFKRGDKLVPYDPKKSKNWKEDIKLQVLASKKRPKEPIDEAIRLEVKFLMPRPKSLPKKVVHHIKRPDLDNLLKAVKDSLKGVIYRDDSLVVSCFMEKYYSPNPGVIIRIWEVN